MRTLRREAYSAFEDVFRRLERTLFFRNSSILHIPSFKLRGGGLGTITYGEWSYIIGIFQTLIYLNINKRPLRMLDIGCGVGRLYLAAKPYITPTDSFIGIDVTKSSVDICNAHYAQSNVSFVHIPSSNAYYSKDGAGRTPWPIDDASITLATALSVWTHLNEADWRFNLGEVSRVLQPGGRAIISFFILDELYDPSNTASSPSHVLKPDQAWVFDTSAYGSAHWKCPNWAEVPEVAIAVDKPSFDEALNDARLRLVSYYPGQWKNQPGVFFQDVAILEKM